MTDTVTGNPYFSIVASYSFDTRDNDNLLPFQNNQVISLQIGFDSYTFEIDQSSSKLKQFIKGYRCVYQLCFLFEFSRGLNLSNRFYIRRGQHQYIVYSFKFQPILTFPLLTVRRYFCMIIYYFLSYE